MKKNISSIFISCDRKVYTVIVERGDIERHYEVNNNNADTLGRLTWIGNHNPSFKYWINLAVYPTIHIDRVDRS